MDLGDLARYPFMPETSAYLKEKEITLDDLVNSSAYSQARDAGRRRVMEAFVDGEVQDRAPRSEVDQIVEVLSYVVARIIVSCTADDLLVQRYGLAEAVTAQRRLLDDNLDFNISVAAFLNLDIVQLNATEVSLHFSDYLKHSSQMRSEEWKLVNQEMENGRIALDHTRLARLLQHAIQEKITGELPLPVNDKIIEAFSSAIDLVKIEIEKKKAAFEKESYGKVSFLRLPPCMKVLLDMMKKGQNVPHVGRFGLTAFLHTIGMTNDEIVAVFSSSPDFKEQLARYQIDHITGKSSGIEYLPPECDTMKSRGVCFDPDSLCNRKWMHHPLTYYRVKGKKKAEQAKKPAEKPEPASE